VFALADAEGRLLYSRADPERYGQELLALGLVRARVSELERLPPPPDWDAIFALETK